MMTFLVIGDFVLNAQLLDDQRLAKQRVEAIQILETIQKNCDGSIGCSTRSWNNHPVVHAWRNYTDALKYYINCVILEFIRRGGNNNLPLFEIPKIIMIPWWCQWDRLHQSHRAMLMRKNPFHYQNTFSELPLDSEYNAYGYIWPHNIAYHNKDAALATITAPIPKELINPVYCRGVLKSGLRSGQACQRLVRDKYPYCTIHRKNHTL